MNIALRAVHDALRTGGNPGARWLDLSEALGARTDPRALIRPVICRRLCA